MNLLEKLTRELRRLGGLLIAVACLPAIAPGTAQVPERLLWQGEERQIMAEPLGQLNLSTYRRQDLEYHTGCQRGYQGHWEILDNRLHLVRLMSCRGNQSIWSILLPDKDAPLLANWYSGVIRIPMGGRIRGMVNVIEGIHQKDVYLVLVEGVLVGQFEVTNDPPPRIVPRPPGVRSPRDQLEADLRLPDDLVEGDWMDSHLVRRMQAARAESTETTLTLRGIYFPRFLYMPGNGAVPAWAIAAEIPEGVVQPAAASPVEVDVTPSSWNRFVFQEFRILEDGEFLDRRGRVLARPWHIREEEPSIVPPMTE